MKAVSLRMTTSGKLNKEQQHEVQKSCGGVILSSALNYAILYNINFKKAVNDLLTAQHVTALPILKSQCLYCGAVLKCTS